MIEFRKSRHSCSGGNCVEIGFRKSSFSGPTGNCVEVGQYGPATVVVRDSKDPGIELSFTRDEWVAFIAGVRAGEFDLL